VNQFRQKPRKVNGTSNPQRSKDARATYLQAELGGHRCDCLLDACSDVTLIHVSVARDAELKETSNILMAANIIPELPCSVGFHYLSKSVSIMVLLCYRTGV